MATHKPEGIACSEWERDWGDPKGRRCRHYDATGICLIPDNFVCVELLRKRAKVAASREPSSIVTPPEKAFRLTPHELTRASRLQHKSCEEFLTATRVQGMPAERLESVATSDVGEVILEVGDVCVEPSGPVVLVAERTGRKDRMELTFRDASTLRFLIDVFPGARVTHLKKRKDDDDEGLQE